MRALRILGGFGLAGLIAFAAIGASGVAAQENVTYTVTFENLTTGQPMTPPVFVAHSDAADIWEVGEAASTEVSQIAENGNNDPLVALAGGAAGVHTHVVAGGPVLPGESTSVTLAAPAGSYLSVVSMLICTNDGFTGVDSWQLPTTGSDTTDTNAYDAGSEQNTEDFANIVPPCQEIIGVTSDDEGTGMSDPALAEGGVISMHGGITGGTDLTVEDHGWTDPVARITVQAGGTGLPSSGTGPIAGDDTSLWLVAAAAAALGLVALGGGAVVARRRVS